MPTMITVSARLHVRVNKENKMITLVLLTVLVAEKPIEFPEDTPQHSLQEVAEEVKKLHHNIKLAMIQFPLGKPRNIRGWNKRAKELNKWGHRVAKLTKQKIFEKDKPLFDVCLVELSGLLVYHDAKNKKGSQGSNKRFLLAYEKIKKLAGMK